MDIGTSYRRKTQTAVPHHVENRRAVFRWVPFGRLEFSRLARVDACQPSATSTSACDRRRYEPLPTDAHLISWACLCPRNDESADKRRSTRIRKSSPGSRPHGCSASGRRRAKDTYLNAQFHRIRARRGPKNAILAVAASILTAVYHMLNDRTLSLARTLNSPKVSVARVERFGSPCCFSLEVCFSPAGTGERDRPWCHPIAIVPMMLARTSAV